jgi:hypothetical protein
MLESSKVASDASKVASDAPKVASDAPLGYLYPGEVPCESPDGIHRSSRELGLSLYPSAASCCPAGTELKHWAIGLTRRA